jgi:hypothetical protein
VSACHSIEVLGVTAAFADIYVDVAFVLGMGGPFVAASAAMTNGEPFPQIKHNAKLTLITHMPGDGTGFVPWVEGVVLGGSRGLRCA